MRRALALLLAIGSVSLGAEDPDSSRCLVGAYYFAGWWEALPNKYTPYGEDWRDDFPGRVPLLGQYKNQPTMDREIAAAAEFGVDFFQILWYPVDDAKRRMAAEGRRLPPHVENVNEGLRLFLASSENHRIRFTVEYVNHAPFGILDDPGWEKTCRRWCAVMRHPSYLQIGGRPVFKVHGLTAFRLQNGEDSDRVAGRIAMLRNVARETGLADPLVGVGVSPLGIPPCWALEPFDFVTTYMEIPRLERRESLYPYEELLKLAQRGWNDYSKHCAKPYVPYVPAGWDPRPWRDPRPSFELPTRGQWKTALESVADALDEQESLGLPTPSGRQRLFLIYAWNEFGEGGMVAPTRGDGYMKLETIRKVFGAAGEKGQDTDTGVTQP